ncbi:MAG TPA: peptidoglycan DD-metalloendopeptidase family protein [Burkholderiaceae bacterium]|nr:peptidoglycan DD-metalloendopeptidase family protein [Burkholderiaceae bacterium]
MKRCSFWTVLLIVAALAACGTQRPAPVVDRSGSGTRAEKPAAGSSAAPARTARDGVYVVQKGDTLYSIASSFGVDVRELARWNGMTDTAVLAVGQSLRVVAPPATATVTPVAPSGTAEVRPLPLPGTESAVPPPPAPVTTTPPGSAPPTAKPEPTKPAAPESAVQWQWPAPGKVIENFDETRNKGIDIAGGDGDPVSAAADGEVVYVGSALRGYGNLVIVKHNEEFISAYAHNRQVLVKQGQGVKRGQRIAEFGRSDADRVKLHFEIRRQGKPVDPLRYLPARSSP